MWLTDVLNSEANNFNFMVAFYRLFDSYFGRPPTIRDWADNVSLLTYGDDAILTVSDFALQFYTPENIGGVFHDMGYRVTAGDKSELTDETRPLEELTFLKSAFVDKPGYVSCPMPIETSFRELNFVKKSHRDNVTVQLGMWNDSLRFAAWHDKSTYLSIYLPLVDKLTELGLDRVIPDLVSYEEVVSDAFLKQQTLKTEHMRTGRLPSIYQTFDTFC
jgi:hypothetical protein